MDLINEMASLICNPTHLGLDKPCYRASDGRVVLTDKAFALSFLGQSPSGGWAESSDLFDRVVKVCDRPFDPVSVDLPAIEPLPWWKNPFEQKRHPCGECDGEGVVSCNYGHDHECEECDGEGFVLMSNLDKGELPIEERYVDLGDLGKFDKRYVWIIGKLAQYKELSFGISELHPAPMLHFSFEDGNGVLMGIMRRK